jgi:hypothetical protein
MRPTLTLSRKLQSLFTWIIFVYQILAEKVVACHGAYNTWAVLSLDGLMIIFWLAAMGAVADTRASFTSTVTVDSCYNDGSTVGSEHCTVEKRAAVASQAGLGAMSGVAGVSALLMLVLPILPPSPDFVAYSTPLKRVHVIIPFVFGSLTHKCYRLLFVASFAYVCHKFRLAHGSGSLDPEKLNGNNGSYAVPPMQHNPHINAGTEMTSNMPAAQQAQPLLNPQGQPQYQVPQQPTWTGHQYAQQPTGYPQQPQAFAAPQYDPYTQQTGYAGSGGVYSPDQVGQPQQVPYNPHGTPVQGHPIYQVPPHQ